MEENRINDELSEIIETMEVIETAEAIEQTEKAARALKLSGFRSVCNKTGFVMCVYYICRILCGQLGSFVVSVMSGAGITAIYIVCTLISVVFLYFVPLVFTMIVFNSKSVYKNRLGDLYKQPNKLARVMGNFPAVYGLGQATNLISMIVIYIVSLFGGRESELAESYKGISADLPPNFACACIFAFVAVVIAPIIEEFWVRGIMLDALKPYGNGFAIVITAVIFGAMHANIRSLFFTTALGLAFGYITYATGSIFTSTVMHAIFNAISSLFVMLMSTAGVSEFMETSDATGHEFVVVVYYFYMLVIYAAVAVGLVSFFKKIRVIRRYRVEKKWADFSFRQRILMYTTSLITIIWVALAVNAHLGDPLTERITELITGG